MAALLPDDDPQALLEAVAAIRSGGIVAFPTDTVYGIGADAFDPSAIHKLFAAKERDENKAIAILLSESAELNLVCEIIPKYAERLAQVFWPGALTLVLQRHPAVPAILSPLPTIGVRIPNHPFAIDLIRACGPLAVTSANLSGQPSAVDAQQVLDQLEGKVSLVIDGGMTRIGIASTVVDCTGPEMVILRAGAISENQLRQAIK